MKKTNRFLSRYSLFDMVVAALLSALGIAVKPVVVPLAHIITGPLLLPGGVVAGGFYMMWLVLGAVMIQKRWIGTLMGLVQAIMVIVLGVYGTHGIISLITYTLPGLAVDIVLLFSASEKSRMFQSFLAGAAANITGTYATSLIFFRLPLIPLLLGLCTAALSGGLGGILAYKVYLQVDKYFEFSIGSKYHNQKDDENEA